MRRQVRRHVIPQGLAITFLPGKAPVLPLVTCLILAVTALTASVVCGQPERDTFDLGPADSTATRAEAWLPAAAAADSISRYWRDLDDRWLQEIPPELLESELPPAVIDSLSQVGDRKVSDLLAGKLWRTSLNPVGRLWYNRVEGFRLGVLAHLYQLGPARPRLSVGLGYGFAAHSWVYDAKLKLPLVTKRRQLPDGTPMGRPWEFWEIELSGGRYVRRFGGDDRWVRPLTAFLYGGDPNQYLESTGGRADLNVRPWQWLLLQGGVIYDDNQPLAVNTTWNLFNGDVEDNIQAVPLHDEAVTAGVAVNWRSWQLWADGQWHRVTDSPLLEPVAGDTDPPDHLAYRRLRAGLTGNLMDNHGNEYILKAEGLLWDRQVPVQWKGFLGDWPTLRGWNARTLAGEEAAWASLDIRFGFDLLRALRVPLLKKWGLQPLALFDWGTVTALEGPQEQPWPDGWLANAGFGFGKLLGVPGYKGNARLYISHPVLENVDQGGWRVLLVFENY